MSSPDPVDLGGALAALDTGVIVLDRDHRIAFWNDWMAAASDVEAAAAMGRPLDELFPDASLNRLRLAVSQALESGASGLLSHTLHPRLLPLHTRTGRPLLHNIAIRAAGEKPYAACVIQVFDVTTVVERERVLRERQNARYDAVMASAADPIVTVGADGLILAANPAATRELGYVDRELIGQPLALLFDGAEAWAKTWRRVWADEPATWPVELVGHRKDGSQTYLEVSASRWSSGALVFVTLILRGINERRAADAQLRLLNDTLEERVRARTAELEAAHEQLRQSQKLEAIGQLTGGIAHDFNNLLSPIVGGLDILQRRGMADPRGQRLVDGALQAAERARVLVQRLLAFARRQPLQPSAVDIGTLIEEMADFVGSTLGPRIRIVLDIEPGLPPALADRNQLEMALLNLAVNARDAMPEGGVLTVGARGPGPSRPEALATGDLIVLSVSDTGEGMDADTLRQAIEPFFSTKEIGKGTGLGLSMIHGLAAQLGGALEIASTPGLGTRVEIWLPAYRGDPAAVNTVALDEGDRGVGVVLLVDDEDLIRDSTSQMLSDLGYTVIEAASAREGLKRLAEGRVDILITDHLMPGMNGAEFAREARTHRPALPILIISGYASLDEIAPDLPRLTKPFRENELATALGALARSDGRA